MKTNIKQRPAGGISPLRTVKPGLRHDVANLVASANAASRRQVIATQPASGTANHARHHVSRHSQS